MPFEESHASSNRRRRCIDHTVRQFGVSERLACRILGQHRSTQRKALKDRTHDGRRFRMLNVIDEFTRECVCIRIDRTLRSTDVIDVLSDLSIHRGVWGHIRSEFGGSAIDPVNRWPEERSGVRGQFYARVDHSRWHRDCVQRACQFLEE